jgi:hypothetical protein
MTKGLDNRTVKWLTYLVYFLLAVLTFSGIFLSAAVINAMDELAATKSDLAQLRNDLPEKYVRLERYSCDTQRIEATLMSINAKLDRALNRGAP